MIWLTAGISLYLLVISVILPLSCGSLIESTGNVDDSLVLIAMSCATLLEAASYVIDEGKHHRRFVRRKRKCVSNIFDELGPTFTKRSYRISETSFWKLYNNVAPFYPKRKGRRKRRGRRGKQNYTNKKIEISLRLSIAIRYFAGGCPLDIMSAHGVGFNDVYNSVWGIVDAVNMCPKITIKFPTCHKKQTYIAEMFSKKSSVGFNNCGGCIDGILIWTSNLLNRF